MPLDFAVLDEHGAPADYVPLSDPCHHAIIVTAQSHGLLRLLRMRDYYDDADYAVEELPDVAREISVAMTSIEPASEAAELLAGMLRLVQDAIREGCTISVIAD